MASSTPQDFLTSLPRHLPTPPFIHVQGIANFRDCGGYECAPPPGADLTIGARYIVRRGVLFRCAHPTNLTPAGARKLREELGITDFFDLRSLPEIEKLAAAAAASAKEDDDDKANESTTSTTTATTKSSKDEAEPALDTSQGFIVIPGISRTFTPVYAQEDYSPVALARKMQWYTAANGQGKDYSEGFVSAYRDIATLLATLDGIEEWKRYADGDEDSNNNKNENASTSNDRTANSYANSKRDGGVVFHCTAGKDRTGVLAAVILRLCGVPDHIIQWEYAITEPGLGDWRTIFIDRISRRGLGGGGAAETVLDGEFGGVDRYLTEMVGLSAREVEGLRKGLAVEVAQDSDIVQPVGIPGWTVEQGILEDEQ
ncbi:hypothetical protein DV735_g3754, partial [Chaetothyriales sp. CBS 134920]